MYVPIFAISGLGQACPPCHFVYGDRCVPCPPGADLMECQECEAKPSLLATYGPEVLTGVVTAVLVTVGSSIVLSRLQKRR